MRKRRVIKAPKGADIGRRMCRKREYRKEQPIANKENKKIEMVIKERL